MAELTPPLVEPVLPEKDTFVTARNSDLTEGRGHTVFERYFDNVEEAVAAAKGISTQGSDGQVYQIVSLLPDKKELVYGTFWISELRINYTGYNPESKWFDDLQLKEAIRRTAEYKEYAALKAKYERYGL